MNKTTYTVDDKECILYSCHSVEYVLIQPVDDHDIELLVNEVEYIANKVGETFALAAFKINAWNDELSPWEAEPVFGKEPFRGCAHITLLYVKQHLIPDILIRCGLPDDIPVLIGGYSLAALFSMWCGYETDTFTAVAAASPSVWFPGWIDYARDNYIQTESVYLSLGDKEEKTKNKIMARVGDSIREQFDMLNNRDDVASTLEWNEGNHFRDSDIRTAKAFVWCINNINRRM